MKGFIIGIEGTDGSGKQTQTNKLLERLLSDGKDVIRQSFPNYESESSGPVRMYLNKELSETSDEISAYQASMFYAVDRFCTYKAGFGKEYNKGKIIIMDRYVQSNMLHQACKISDLQERDKFLNWLEDIEFDLFELPKPDIVVFLDMPVEVNLKLMEGRQFKTGNTKDLHEQDSTHLEKAYNAGKYVAQKYGWLVISCVDKDGNVRTREDIHEEIYSKIKDKIGLN